MARTHEATTDAPHEATNVHELHGADALTAAWLKTAASSGYTVIDGAPVSGVAGFIVRLEPPVTGFDAIPEDNRRFVQQAVFEMVLNRVGAPAAKKPDASVESVQAAVSAALRDGHKPSKARDKLVFSDEVDALFEAKVRELIAAKMPDAPEHKILTTIEANRGNGRIWENAVREVAARGRYAVSERKAKNAKPEDAISLDDM